MIRRVPLKCIAIVCISGLLILGEAVGQESAKDSSRDSAKKPTTTRVDSPTSKTPSKNSQVVKLFNGKDLKGLRVLTKSYFEDHGPVKVVKGELRINAGMPGSGIAIDPKRFKDLPRINYEVVVEGKRVEGGDFFCGLTFPVNDSYCTLILGGWGGGSIGLSNVDRMSAVENETSGFEEFENGKWYTIRLRVTEQTISATLNRKDWKQAKKLFAIATAEHKYDIWWEQEPARPLGISTWSTTSSFRRFELRPLQLKKSENSESKK